MPVYPGWVAEAKHLSPGLLTSLPPDAGLRPPEVAALEALHRGGVAVAPIVVVPAGAEERFYRLNNLVPQLAALFRGVDPADPDEDELEEFAPAALALFKSHFLLDEFIDLFYTALAALPAAVRVRRAGEAGVKSVRGRPALVALKDAWAAEWRFEALVERLGRSHTFALEARPVLVGPAAETPASPELVSQVRELLERSTQVWTTDLGISRLRFDEPTA